MVSQPDTEGGSGHVLAQAVVFEKPQALTVRQLELTPPEKAQVLVEVEWTGISTGTEKLLWSGRMPEFPGMGYPLVPGYETVGRVAAVGPDASVSVGDRVFVSGASCYGDIRGLFGGAASRLVVEEHKLIAVGEDLEEEAILPGRDELAQRGFYVEPTSAIVWDALYQVLGRAPEPVVAVLTGAGFKYAP